MKKLRVSPLQSCPCASEVADSKYRCADLPLALACSLVPGLLPWILPQDTQAAQLLFSQRAPDALITNVEDLADAAPLVFPPGLDGLQDAESQEPPSIDVYQTVVLTSALSDGKWSIIELSNLVSLAPRATRRAAVLGADMNTS